MLRSPFGRSLLMADLRTCVPVGVGVVAGDKMWPEVVKALMMSAVVGGAAVAALARGCGLAALTACNSCLTASNCWASSTVAVAVSLMLFWLVVTAS